MLYCFLQSNPAVRMLMPLLLGVFLAEIISFPAYALLLCLVGVFFVVVLLSFQDKRITSSVGVGLLLCFAVLGVFVVQHRKESYVLPTDLEQHYVKAILGAAPTEKERSMAVPLTVVQLQKGEKILPAHFKSIAYFPKDSMLQQWNYGDTILAQLQFFPLHDYGNPYAFNYAKLLQQRQIYCTAKGNLKQLTWQEGGFSVFRYARLTQKKLSVLLDSYIPNKKASGFLQAISLGDRTSLSPEVQVDFADAGVVHILAVSGLHVGILFVLLNFALRPLRVTRRRRVFVVVVGFLVIWSFAFISGLSVSIQRAAIMFSVLQFSMVSLRPYRIYNAIAISAFIMLLINPFYLCEVGFQLSYMAVLSIVTFVPIWDKCTVQNDILDKFKKLLLVSLAAQLGVAPLVLYYFHHLPTYFLLGNLIVLLLAPLLLGGSLLVLLFSFVPIVAKALGILVSGLTKICMFLVNAVATLPRATLLDYSLDFYQMLFVYLLLFAVALYFFKRKSTYFFTVLGCLFVLVSYTSWRNYEERHQEMFVVHYAKDKSCYSLLKGREALLLGLEKSENERIDYNVRPLWEAKGISKVQFLTDFKTKIDSSIIYKSGHAWVGNQHIVVCAKNASILDQPIAIDILVLSKESDWQSGVKNYKARQIVLDSSFTQWQSQKLAKELSALNFSVHNVNVDGAYVMN